MLVNFRCPNNTIERVNEMVEAGLYPDFSTFCRIALENQLLMEEKHQESPVPIEPEEGTLGVHESRETSPLQAEGSEALDAKGSKMVRTKMVRTKRVKQANKLSHIAEPEELTHERVLKAHMMTTRDRPREGPQEDGIPPILKLEGLTEKPPFELEKDYTSMHKHGDQISVDRWLFGQMNRLFPAKVAIRGLSKFAMGGKGDLMLEAVGPKIADAASKLGDYLRDIDKRFGYHRDNSVATGFPEVGPEGDKGRDRFKYHFVGHTHKGQPGGLLVALNLAVIKVQKNKPHIYPTLHGWQFAKLVNPMLDQPPQEKSARLSEDEVTFLLEHVENSIPVELFSYRTVLSLIDEGRNTPTKLNDSLETHLDDSKTYKGKSDVITTQRNGVIGRMADLGLVSRERKGTKITYRVTEKGKGFLARINQ